MKDTFENRNKSFLIASPTDNEYLKRKCTEESIRVGAKAGAIALVATAVPIRIAVRTIPWFKAYLKPNGQAFLISSATIATFHLNAEHASHECQRKNAFIKRTM